MPKLHELLAAESSVAASYNAIIEESLKVLGKPDHFLKAVKQTTYFDEDKTRLNTIEVKDMVTTVDQRLDYTFGRPFQNYIDMIAQKDRTNQEARADVIVNGHILLADVPATTLLALEAKLGDVRRVLDVIPTLQPGPVWQYDEGTSSYKTANPAITFKTEKTIKPVTIHPGNDKHAPQMDKINVDSEIAKIESTIWSSMWTSRDKHDALARLDALLIAVKKARQRANRTDVKDIHVGAPVVAFLLHGPSSGELIGSDTEAG